MSPTAAISALPNPDQAKQIMAAWEHFLRDSEVPTNVVRKVIMHKHGITRPYYENGENITTV